MATKTDSTGTEASSSRSSKANKDMSSGLHELLDTAQKGEHSALDAMHRFADSVNESFPDVGDEGDGPRGRIIDAAFKLTSDIVDAGHRMAVNIVDITEDAVRGLVSSEEATAG